MRDKDHAIWDTHFAWPLRTPSESGTASQRAKHRADRFEYADTATPDLVELARWRMDRFSLHNPSNLWRDAERGGGCSIPIVVAVLGIVGLVTLIVERSANPKPATWAGWSVLRVLGPSLVTLAFWVGLIVRNKSIATAASRGRCPDCRYDLSACPRKPGLSRDELGVDIGPARCPECGAFWPLIPPEGPTGATSDPLRSDVPKYGGPTDTTLPHPSPGKDHAAWDHLDSLPHLAKHDPALPLAVQYARQRTAIVEAPPAPDTLRSELTRRRIYWRASPRAPRDLMSPGREKLVRILPWLAIPAAFIALIGLIATGIFSFFTVGGTSVALQLMLLPGVGLMVLIFELQKARTARRAASNHCPDCDYDLAGVPSELDEAVYSVESGPRRCSECGALWPLVPPAIPPVP